MNSLADFKGLKVGIGPENSGTRLLAETILNLYGVDSKNTTFIDQTHSIHFDMMEKGELDVGFFLLPANNQFVFKLGTNPSLKIFSLNNSKAISRRFDYLYPEIVQAGGFDLRNNIPNEDIQVVSLPVDLVAKKNLDPSIVVAISLILKEEFKESEGSPEVKARMRRMQMEASQRAAEQSNAIEDVKDATVVITNPTHFAVAIKYEPSLDDAPVILAMGKDIMAKRVIEQAELHSKTIVRSPVLARALYFTGNIGQAISEQLYSAVASILAYVYQLERGVDATLQEPDVPNDFIFDENGRTI